MSTYILTPFAEARVQLEPERYTAQITGRNGTFDLTSVSIDGCEQAYIDGWGKRQHRIRGGIRLPASKMDQLAKRWLIARHGDPGKASAFIMEPDEETA